MCQTLFHQKLKDRINVLEQSLNRKLAEEKQAEDLEIELNEYRVELSKCGIFQGKKRITSNNIWFNSKASGIKFISWDPKSREKVVLKSRLSLLSPKEKN